jgi:hypothetical protein
MYRGSVSLFDGGTGTALLLSKSPGTYNVKAA